MNYYVISPGTISTTILTKVSAGMPMEDGTSTPITEEDAAKELTVLQQQKIFRNKHFKDRTFEIQHNGGCFISCNFENVQINNSDLSLSTFYFCNFFHSEIKDVNLNNVGFFSSHFFRITISESEFRYARFIDSSMAALHFTNCDLLATLFYLKKEYYPNISFSLCNQEEAYFGKEE